MDSREAIVQAAIALMEEHGEHLEQITVREICKRADVGLGLVNYHFGNKENLIAYCVSRKINEVIAQFQRIREETERATPFEKLEALGNLTLDFLFAHEAISRISVLSDMQSPQADDNTSRTYEAYLPLVAACRPDWDAGTVRRKTFCLIAVMQQIFLRQEAVSHALGIDLREPENRRTLHRQILRDILEV